jgi:hypothetical protein
MSVKQVLLGLWSIKLGFASEIGKKFTASYKFKHQVEISVILGESVKESLVQVEKRSLR